MLLEQTIEDAMHSEAVVDAGLYRGLISELHEPTKMPIRTDRIPRNTSISSSVLFNVGFASKFGEPDIRKRSAYCTTNIDVAHEYSYGTDQVGGIVEVAPLKSSKLAYCAGVSDSITVCEQLENQFGGYDETTNHIISLLDESDYSQPSSVLFANACKEAGASQEHIDHFTAVIEQVLSKYTIIPAGPVSASDVEVMLFGADYYYAVPVEGMGDDFFD